MTDVCHEWVTASMLSALSRASTQTMSSARATTALKEKAQIMTRNWKTLSNSANSNVRLMSWNMLAQCLVRRELFPTSDCLKANQREGMLFSEIINNEADILCLQEVDRLEKLIPFLQDASYDHIYASGPGKRHGCMIAYSRTLFEQIGHSTVYYDDLLVNEAFDSNDGRKELSRLTKNIGLIAALKRLDSSSGFIIATTHLFWHPRFTYERIRQSILLLREVQRFQQRQNLSHWPCIIAGDFNFPPTDPGYSLLVGETLTSEQWKQIDESRVVHVSIDTSLSDVSASLKAPDDENADPDRELTNTRLARSNDALLSNEEIIAFFQCLFRLESAYERAQRVLLDESSLTTLGNRLESFPSKRIGYYEPTWTSYTHYWKSTLDYIFISIPNEMEIPHLGIKGFLETPQTSTLEPGLPMKNKCGSDHISLVVEIG